MVEINVTEIFAKLRTKSDIINFFREQSKFFMVFNLNY